MEGVGCKLGAVLGRAQPSADIVGAYALAADLFRYRWVITLSRKNLWVREFSHDFVRDPRCIEGGLDE